MMATFPSFEWADHEGGIICSSGPRIPVRFFALIPNAINGRLCIDSEKL